ncbi:MAG: GC-type dockerin domain-anchored protein [Phycisphaerales bacterium]|jgi:hypothetical protein|nr:GC-type dockerin domain-anchored protein [Phycisphaerales bacterium]
MPGTSPTRHPHRTPGARWAGPLIACVLAAVASGSLGADPPPDLPVGVPRVVYDFAGTLPPGASFSRAGARMSSTGVVFGDGQPRWVDTAIGVPARIVGRPSNLSPLGVGILEDGRVLTAVGKAGVRYPMLTFDTPGVDANPVLIAPSIPDQARFDYDAEIGVISAASVTRSGLVVFHGTEGSSNNKQTMVVSHPDTMPLVGGTPLVYTVPDRILPEYVTQTPLTFTSPTHLPNLNIDVVTAVEYMSQGPDSAIAFGATSADGFTTWTRLIHFEKFQGPWTLDDGTVIAWAKHVHRIVPFEFFRDGSWRIGALALLGDGGNRITIRIESSGDRFEGPGITLRRSAIKEYNRCQLTDAFLFSPSETPEEPLRFLNGIDGASSGMVVTELSGDVARDRFLFRPMFNIRGSTLAGLPYIYRIMRMTNGTIIAPGGHDAASYSPEGIWQADPSGEHWTVVHQDGATFRGIGAIDQDRAWIRRVSSTQNNLMEFGPIVVRPALELAGPVTDYDVRLTPYQGAYTTPSDEPPPAGVDPTTRVFHLNSTSVAKAVTLTSGSVTTALPEGTGVFGVFWIKPVSLRCNTIDLELLWTQTSPAGQTTTSPYRYQVGPDFNDWTRIVLPVVVQAGGVSRMEFRIRTFDAATPERPLDVYMTEPQLIAAEQIGVQPAFNAQDTPALTPGESLTVDLPELGDEWTILVWGVEAPDLAFSLADAQGQGVEVYRANPDQSSNRTGFDVSMFVRTSAGAQAMSVDRDTIFPTQTFIALTRDASGQLHTYLGRGMGSDLVLGGLTRTEALAPIAFNGTPTTFHAATLDGSRTLTGQLHRVVVFPDAALTREQVESEMAVFEAFCAADFNGDRLVDSSDFLAFLNAWVKSDPRTDVHTDGFFNSSDFLTFLGAWAEGCPE